MPVAQTKVTLTVTPVITTSVAVSSTPGFTAVTFTCAGGVSGAMFIVQRSFNAGAFIPVCQVDAQQSSFTDLIPTGSGAFSYKFAEVSSNQLVSGVIGVTP